MKLIVGGAFQGKKAFAQSVCGRTADTFTDGADCPLSDAQSCAVLMHFHLYIKRMLQQGQDTDGLADALFQANPEILLISNEVGNGVVPVDAFERRYREAVGRVCTRAAALSEAVYRVTCGIGVRIK